MSQRSNSQSLSDDQKGQTNTIDTRQMFHNKQHKKFFLLPGYNWYVRITTFIINH